MKVLVTNDDGYTAIGIKKLVEKIKGKYEEIVVIAPKTQKSATSHSIILKGGIEFKQVDDIVEGIKTYYCDGNPADCVSFARCVLKYPYDLVISGCNNGINLGRPSILQKRQISNILKCCPTISCHITATAFCSLKK